MASRSALSKTSTVDAQANRVRRKRRAQDLQFSDNAVDDQEDTDAEQRMQQRVSTGGGGMFGDDDDVLSDTDATSSLNAADLSSDSDNDAAYVDSEKRSKTTAYDSDFDDNPDDTLVPENKNRKARRAQAATDEDTELDGLPTAASRRRADKEQTYTARLRQQGIDATDDADPEDQQLSAKVNKLEQRQPTVDDAERARQARIRAVMERDDDGAPMESFTMTDAVEGERQLLGSSYVDVSEVEQKERDPWLATQTTQQDDEKSDFNVGRPTDADDLLPTTTASSAKRAKFHGSTQPLNAPDATPASRLTPSQARQTLLQYLQPGENVLQCIRRVGGVDTQQDRSKQKKPLWQRQRDAKRQHQAQSGKPTPNNITDQPMQTESPALQPATSQSPTSASPTGNATPSNHSAELQARKLVDIVTEAADTLLGAGDYDVYQATAQLLKRQAEQDSATAPDMFDGDEEDGDEAEWVYKTSPTDDKQYGPLPASHMQSWQAQGYLDGAVCKLVGTAQWVPAAQVTDWHQAQPAPRPLPAPSQRNNSDTADDNAKQVRFKF